MTSQELEHLIGFAECSYDCNAKDHFKALSLKLLREVRSILGGRNNEDIRVSFNPGGIAVSGESILHSDKVYIQLSGSPFGFTILVRAVSSKTDYTGKANHYYRPQDLLEFRAAGLAQYAKSIWESHTSLDWSQKPVCNTCREENNNVRES